MRIYSIQNCEFSGRLKHGDLLKKLNDLNQVAKVKVHNASVFSDATEDGTLYKIFDNPDHLTPKDHTKIVSSASSTVGGLISSRAATVTEGLDTWSIYSIFS